MSCSNRAIVRIYTGHKLEKDTGVREYFGASSQVFEKYRGNSSFRKYRIECLLRSAIDTLWGEENNARLRMINNLFKSCVKKPEVCLSSIQRLTFQSGRAEIPEKAIGLIFLSP